MNYFKKSSQEVNVVYQTNDLEMFNAIKGNRPPNPQHIRRLCDSIRVHGILQNPIIVNEKMDIIDGHHRLMAAKAAKSSIYFIIVRGYELKEVHVLNLNQKNWTTRDFMEGYADMGIESYIKLRNFTRRNKEFTISDAVALCGNILSSGSSFIHNKYRHKDGNIIQQKEVFEEGTWKGKDFDLAQSYADKIKMIKPYYKGYARSSFVVTMLGLFRNPRFDFIDFVNKLKLQQQKMIDCATVAQYKTLIEEIYNYRRREKVNLRF